LGHLLLKEGESAGASLPLEGRVAATRPGGDGSAGYELFFGAAVWRKT
jgi:hypothetical protein